ncbi:MAG: LEA type 2 family protein [Proteobacteria bacterium]|nr:LEA type 2 family protein [Pseudomonadota bacterium]
MPLQTAFRNLRALAAIGLLATTLLLGACGGIGTKLQPPTASIQQLTVNSDGTWAAVVRFQNYSYDTGMHVYAIDATLSLNGKPAGRIAFSPTLDIPAMDADIGNVTFKPDAAGATALAEAKRNAIQYELKGTLSVGKGVKGSAQSFKLDGKGYISPVPGVSNIWR